MRPHHKAHEILRRLDLELLPRARLAEVMKDYEDEDPIYRLNLADNLLWPQFFCENCARFDLLTEEICVVFGVPVGVIHRQEDRLFYGNNSRYSDGIRN